MGKRTEWKRLAVFVMALVMLFGLRPVQAEAKTVKMGNTFENQQLGSGSVEYKNRIYYGLTNKLYSVKKDGTDKKLVLKMPEGDNGFYRIAAYDGWLYAIFDYYGGSDSSDNHLLKISPDGKKYSSLCRANNFSIVNGKIYCTKTKHIPGSQDENGFFTSPYNKVLGLYSMDLNGKSTKKLISGEDVVLYGVDGKKIYYGKCDWNSGKTSIYTSDMKGANKKKIKTASNVSAVFFYGNELYFQASDQEYFGEYSIYQVDMKTGTTKEIYSTADWISAFYVEKSNLYISSDSGLQKVSPSTGKKETINKQIKNGIRGIHGSVLVGERYRMDMTAGTDYDVLLIKKTGKTLKKIGAYFVS